MKKGRASGPWGEDIWIGSGGAETNSDVILRARTTPSCARLEGWKQAHYLLPCFETAARKRARPPQHDGCVVAMSQKPGLLALFISAAASAGANLPACISEARTRAKLRQKGCVSLARPLLYLLVTQEKIGSAAVAEGFYAVTLNVLRVAECLGPGAYAEELGFTRAAPAAQHDFAAVDEIFVGVGWDHVFLSRAEKRAHKFGDRDAMSLASNSVGDAFGLARLDDESCLRHQWFGAEVPARTGGYGLVQKSP
jgi:hypothetical protein